MPKPGDMAHKKIEKPKNDNEFFERMSRVIFTAGLNWRILEAKWPGIMKAFAGFDINKVAQFSEAQIEELMFNKDIIRNMGKLKAIVGNAKLFQEISKEDGSFANYLVRLRKEGGEDMLREQIAKRFGFMGKGTTVIFLFYCGEKLPKAEAEMKARHEAKN